MVLCHVGVVWCDVGGADVELADAQHLQPLALTTSYQIRWVGSCVMWAGLSDGRVRHNDSCSTCVYSKTPCVVCRDLHIIMEYGSTPYVGMAPKKMASPLTVYKMTC